MNYKSVLCQLNEKEIITSEFAAKVEEYEAEKPFSIHWELRSILYIGILLFSGGIGVLVYQNIDTIGHQAIIAFIAIITIACFVYVYRHRQPFSWHEVDNSSSLSSYILLLGCTAFLTLEGYLQFQYQVFGEKYGLAVFIPTIVFFLCAYFFDHRGVLSMAITGLASWAGLTIAPLSILEKNDFTDLKIVHTAIILGIILIAVGFLTARRNWKRHFEFTYHFLGGNLAIIAAMIGLFSMDMKVFYFIIAAGLSSYFVYYARKNHALLFLLMGVIYGYIILTYSLFLIMPDFLVEGLIFFYFIASSGGVIIFLLNVKKILGLKKGNEGI